MPGFRAAGWTCFAAAIVSISIALLFLRDIGTVGKLENDSQTVSIVADQEEKPESDLEKSQI
jgi:hypothetical protein